MSYLLYNSLLLLCPVLAIQADNIEPSQRLEVVALKDPVVWVNAGEEQHISLSFLIKKAYYIQADQVRDDNLIPTTLTFEATDELLLGDPVFPKAQEHQIDETTLYVFGSEIEINIPVKILEPSEKKVFHVKGKLHYQACDKTQCYFPRDYDFMLKVNVL